MARKLLSKYMTWVFPGYSRCSFFELLVSLEGVPEIEEKAKILREFARRSKSNAYAVGMFFETMMNPKLEWGLPAGDPPPYRCGSEFPDKVASGFTQQAKKMPYFLKGYPTFISNMLKREKVFIQMLESMCDGDAALLVALRNRDWSVMKGVSAEILCAAFPNWVRPGYVNTTKVEVVEDPKKADGGAGPKKKPKKRKKKSKKKLEGGNTPAASSGTKSSTTDNSPTGPTSPDLVLP